jgi:dTDP-4-amino-4,6-dideoxygalactose transaminase
MTSPFRHLAPAGAPIRLRDLGDAAVLVLSGRDVTDLFRKTVESRFGVRRSFLTSTGRAGMTVLLKALRRLSAPERNEVIVPSYTCFSVAAAVVKAGLRPRLVDVSTETLGLHPGRLQEADYSRVLAIVATNLYGFPDDLAAISALARAHGVFLIDDAAQSMGAMAQGRLSGTWGDAGLFSLDKGKNVTAIDGGVVVTNSEAVASALDDEMRALEPSSPVESAAGAVKAMAYWAMLRPFLYWIPARIPQLGLGRTVFTTDFPLAAPSRVLIALGVSTLPHLADFTRDRVARASLLVEKLRCVPGVRTVEPTAGSTPVYLRLPVLVGQDEVRDRALDALNAAGIGATGSYPTSLADVPGLRASLANADAPMTGGRAVARRLLTLPTHAFVTSRDIDRIVDVLSNTVGASPLAAPCAEPLR